MAAAMELQLLRQMAEQLPIPIHGATGKPLKLLPGFLLPLIRLLFPMGRDALSLQRFRLPIQRQYCQALLLLLIPAVKRSVQPLRTLLAERALILIYGLLTLHRPIKQRTRLLPEVIPASSLIRKDALCLLLQQLEM